MSVTDCAVLIPARYQSVRFPGKLLADLNGRPLVSWTALNCEKTGIPTWVVTDDDRIESALAPYGHKVMRVDDDVPSGTERLALATQRHFDSAPDIIINVQGDEPMVSPEVITKVRDFHIQSGVDVTTVVRRRQRSVADFQNPNCVKAVFESSTGKCLYFSRASVPFDRDGNGSSDWFHHMGMYAYSAHALNAISKMDPCESEEIERLEQLRFLANGLTIGAIEWSGEFFGVDTPQDLEEVKKQLKV